MVIKLLTDFDFVIWAPSDIITVDIHHNDGPVTKYDIKARFHRHDVQLAARGKRGNGSTL